MQPKKNKQQKQKFSWVEHFKRILETVEVYKAHHHGPGAFIQAHEKLKEPRHLSWHDVYERLFGHKWEVFPQKWSRIEGLLRSGLRPGVQSRFASGSGIFLF